jgi:hypothetical protein
MIGPAIDSIVVGLTDGRAVPRAGWLGR